MERRYNKCLSLSQTSLFWLVLLLMSGVLIFAACNGKAPLLPQSGGRPYEVLVVGDHDARVAQALQTDVAGLPQPEPSFDVSTVDSAQFEGNLRMARVIVVVTVDPVAFPRPRIRYERNVWAQPQLVVYVGAPSTAQLLGEKGQQTSSLCRLITVFETNVELNRLKRHRNVRAEQMVRKTFGMDLLVPEDMVASKRKENFIWLSNNSATAMSNVVIYRLPEDRIWDIPQFVALRDSALGRNIKGETDQMKMRTVANTVSRSYSVQGKQRITVYRGLWEMEGDDMGGPFVARIQGDICVEAFVFAPGKKKRNMMRRLEAMLYSLGHTQ